MSSVQAVAELVTSEPDYTDTPPADGRGLTISCDRGCGFPSSRADELLRLLSQPMPTRARRAHVLPAGPVHQLLTLDIARVFRRP